MYQSMTMAGPTMVILSFNGVIDAQDPAPANMIYNGSLTGP